MAKRKIAILGGGIAGLAAAYELTGTQELRDQHEITVYQMGWRLGGKVASGRDEHGRNREHGLHVWFGCYENVFRLTRDIYREWQGPADSPLKSVEDVAKPQIYTPIGVKYNDQFLYFPLNWPLHPGVPGDGHETLWTPREALQAISDLFIKVMRDTAADQIKLRANGMILDAWPAQLKAAARLPERFATILASSLLSADERDRGTTLWERSQTTPLSFGQNAEAAYLLTRALLSVPDAPDHDAAQHVLDLYERALAQF